MPQSVIELHGIWGLLGLAAFFLGSYDLLLIIGSLCFEAVKLIRKKIRQRVVES